MYILLPLITYCPQKYSSACFFLDGYETWSLTLREEHRRSVLAGRVHRRIFVSKGQKVLAGRRMLHIEELNDGRGL
jgi:hypothetical protein